MTICELAIETVTSRWMIQRHNTIVISEGKSTEVRITSEIRKDNCSDDSNTSVQGPLDFKDKKTKRC